jgi:hypothetical protein
MIDPDSVRLSFAGELWYWRGPSPYHFVMVPDDACGILRAIAPVVSYGWGVIPVRARARGRTWDTSLFPRDGGFVLPVKDAVRLGEALELGEVLEIELTIRHGRPVR